MYIQATWLSSVGIPKSTLYRRLESRSTVDLGVARRFVHIDDAIEILLSYVEKEQRLTQRRAKKRETPESARLERMAKREDMQMALNMLKALRYAPSVFTAIAMPCPRILFEAKRITFFAATWLSQGGDAKTVAGGGSTPALLGSELSSRDWDVNEGDVSLGGMVDAQRTDDATDKTAAMNIGAEGAREQPIEQAPVSASDGNPLPPAAEGGELSPQGADDELSQTSFHVQWSEQRLRCGEADYIVIPARHVTFFSTSQLEAMLTAYARGTPLFGEAPQLQDGLMDNILEREDAGETNDGTN